MASGPIKVRYQELGTDLASSLASLRPFRLKRSSIVFPKSGSDIGSGGFGTVYRAKLQKQIFGPRIDVAVKKLSTTGDWEKRRSVSLALARELLVWAALKHPNVLPLLGFHLSGELNEAWLISPLAPKGNISQFLQHEHPPVGKRLELAKDTAMGLKYLHIQSPPICHGDIKAVNVLVSADDRAMLCDFGLSRKSEEKSEEKLGDMSFTLATIGPNAGGTIRYCSPELFVPNSHPTPESDTWAWGCLLLEIVTDRVPYDDVKSEGQVIHQITDNIPPATLGPDDQCPQHVQVLLTKCWKQAPDERPPMADVIAELTAGTIHFLQDASRQTLSVSTMSTASSASSLALLERELFNLTTPFQSYALKREWLTSPNAESVIGAGSYSTVHQMLMRRNKFGPPELVAVKKLRPVGEKDKRLRMAIALIRELTVWSDLRHTNILPFTGYHLAHKLEEAWLVAPYMQNGNLSGYLLLARPDEDTRLQLALDTAKGLHYLHTLEPPVCHGDIKSLNVLIADDRSAVLCDFGLAKTMETMPSGLTTSTFNQAGSIAYESPELLMGTSLRVRESDVWAWGCLLQEIFSGKYPYYWATNPGAVVKWITQNVPPAISDEIRCPPRVRRLFTRCWQTSPTTRPTMTQCVAVLTGKDDEVDQTLGIESANALRIEKADLLMNEACRLGSGRFGTVFRTRLRGALENTPEGVVAVKELFRVFDETERARLERNVLSWAALKHPNVLPFRGFCKDHGNILLVYTHHHGATLAAYIDKGPLTYKRRMDLATETAQGLLYLHTRNPAVFHGDVHLDNVFVSIDGHPLLSDYGVSTTVDMTKVAKLVQTDDKWRYSSPELLTKHSEPTARSDVWSWSCLFLKIITGKNPYESVTKADSLTEHVLPATVETLECPPRAQNIMGHCWKHDPKLRPPMSEVLAILTGRASRFEKVTNVDVKKSETVEALIFSRDGLRFAVVLQEAIQILSTNTWKCEVTLTRPTNHGILCLLFSPSNRFFAMGTNQGDVLIWDLRSGKPHETYSELTREVYGIDISADDNFVVASSTSGEVRLWLLGDEREGRVLQSGDGSDPAYSVTISPKCDIVAVGCNGVRVLDVQTGDLLATLVDGWMHSIQFSPDGCCLFSCNSRGEVKRWDVTVVWEGVPNKSHFVSWVSQARRSTTAISISPDNDWFATICVDSGDVQVGRTESSDYSHSPVGEVPADGFKWRGVSLGPISNSASGLAAGCGAGIGTAVVVYKYALWDSKGAYLV